VSGSARAPDQLLPKPQPAAHFYELGLVEDGVLSISISLIVGYFLLPRLVIANDERQSCNVDTLRQIALLGAALLFAPQQRLLLEALE